MERKDLQNSGRSPETDACWAYSLCARKGDDLSRRVGRGFHGSEIAVAQLAPKLVVLSGSERMIADFCTKLHHICQERRLFKDGLQDSLKREHLPRCKEVSGSSALLSAWGSVSPIKLRFDLGLLLQTLIG
jgi:hypothetical protein